VIIYNPLDGEALTSAIRVKPRHCFLMTRLGSAVPAEVQKIRVAITQICDEFGYSVIDASSRVSGRDFLLKIWKMIAATPLAVGVCHEALPAATQGNIFYELGVAQALGKETLLIKSRGVTVPSDFTRTEYIEFDESFDRRFAAYLADLEEQALHYETVAGQLQNNPVLAIDYLKRAYLISGDVRLKTEAEKFLDEPGFGSRARNSVELLAAAF
jgi:hypothetical protein